MSDLLKKQHHFNLLYSFYGSLLTDLQQKTFEYYYFDDLSLAEIALELKVSRNAVFDTIKKVECYLEDFEIKMKLLQKEEMLDKLLDKYDELVDDLGKELIKKIKERE